MSAYDEAYDAGGDDSVPFDVNDEVEVDVSDQEGNDVIPPFRKVRFEIKKASLDINTDKATRKWLTKKLALEVAVAEGVDEEGKYKGKRFFPRFLLVYNKADWPGKFDSDWWKKKSRFDTKDFFKAMSIDPAHLKVDDDFLAWLVGLEFIADIQRRERREKVNGEYQGTGEYENELKNFRMGGN